MQFAARARSAPRTSTSRARSPASTASRIEDWLPWGVVGVGDAHQLAVGVHVNHGITMIAGGNAVAFNAHPGCSWTSMRTVELMNQADRRGRRARQPVAGVVAPSLDSARALVTHARRRHALHHGRRGAGARRLRHRQARHRGRPRHARLGASTRPPTPCTGPRAEILNGAIFDNTILCIGEKAVVAADAVYDRCSTAFADLPAHMLTDDETEQRLPRGHRRLRQGTTRARAASSSAATPRCCWPRPALGAASRSGLLVAPVEREHPLFWMEQFLPFLPVVRTQDGEAAIDLGIEAEGRNRHTAMIYSNFPPNVERFAREMSTVVTTVVNGCSLRGLGVEGEGYPGFAIGTVTGEGITSPRHFAQVRRVARIR